MKKSFVIEDLECAHCAAKIEEAIKKLDGVNSAAVNFLAQKIIIDAEDDRFDEIIGRVVEICKETEPDCKLVI